MAFKQENTNYPVGLTNADWQAKKKPAGKLPLKAKTGLGAQLVKAQTAWNGLEFDKLDAARAGARGLLDTLAAKRNAEAMLKGSVKQTIKTLKSAATKADTTAKNILLAKSSRDRATYIAENLRKRADILGKIKLDDFDPLVKRAVSDELSPSARTLEADLDDWGRRSSPQLWDSIQKNVTGLATAVRSLAQEHKLEQFTPQVAKWNKAHREASLLDPYAGGVSDFSARSAAEKTIYAVREALGELNRAW